MHDSYSSVPRVKLEIAHKPISTAFFIFRLLIVNGKSIESSHWLGRIFLARVRFGFRTLAAVLFSRLLFLVIFVDLFIRDTEMRDPNAIIVPVLFNDDRLICSGRPE
jgi:hypothetical protein